MKTLAFAIITAAALATEGDGTIALVAFIGTCIEAFFDDSLRIVFNNNIKVNKEGGDHA